MNLKEDILLHLKSHPFWDDFQKQIIASRPSIPGFNPSDQNVDHWKKESGRQEGYDLCLKLFNIEVNHE